MDLGLALSGGGSRAAAFHRGTLRGLLRVGLLDAVDCVSTVSGGSVFGAAWAASRADGTSAEDFLAALRHELATGFVARAARRLPTVLTGATFTHMFAELFNGTVCRGKRLSDIPEKPALCINATVLNSGQVAKFTKAGLSATGLLTSREPSDSNKIIPLHDFPLGLAVAASAAFPFGLPPISLRIGREVPGDLPWSKDILEEGAIALTDGGVLENLGVQTLLKSRRYGCIDIISSDAGAAEQTWHESQRHKAVNFFLYAFSASTLRQLLEVMASKQNRHMRELLYQEFELSWLAEAHKQPNNARAFRAFLDEQTAPRRRRALYVRLDQTWERFLRNIPAWRLMELADRGGPGAELHELPGRTDAHEIEGFLRTMNINFAEAEALAKRVQSKPGVRALNGVATNFTALPPDVIDALADHAEWQVLANYALWW